MYFSRLTLTVAIFQSPVSEVPEFSMEASREQSSLSSVEPVVPEPITLPSHDEWGIFITCCGSTAEIWGRLIGEEYSVSICCWFAVRVSSLSGTRETGRCL
jgi:hypothetical protein